MLRQNLEDLKALRRKTGKSRSIIIVRVMFRPSQIGIIDRELEYWRRLADTAMPAPVCRLSHEVDGLHYYGDIFTLAARRRQFPVCYFPFNEINVSADGHVLLCDALAFRKNLEQIQISSLDNATLTEIWNGARLKRLRSGHRHRNEADLVECKACSTR